MTPKKRISLLHTLVILLSLAALACAPPVADGAPPDPCRPGSVQGEEGSQACEKKGTRQYSAAPVVPATTSSPDHYGYTWNDSVTYTWVDTTTGGTQIFASGIVDDAIAGPFNLGFNFKFYEGTFSQVYIGSNGLLGFNDSIGEDTASLINLSIPIEFEVPGYFVAPFWDDLKIGTGTPPSIGRVFYKSGSDLNGNYFAIEWNNVTRFNSLTPITFEVLLYQSGDIVFQYGDLGGVLDSATVGIEDGEGTDGTMFLYNASGLASNKDIKFTRPPASARVKALPDYQGAFSVARRSSFRVQFRNTGELGADTFDLQAASSELGWGIKLYAANGVTLLSNTNGDPRQDTGSLAMGATATVIVKVTAPVTAIVGDETTVTLTAFSNLNPAKSASVQLVSAIPSAFAFHYVENQAVKLQLAAPHDVIDAVGGEFYTGSRFALSTAAGGKFFSIWERNIGQTYTDLEYNLIDSLGRPAFSQPRRLTDNSNTVYDDIRDSKPVVAMAPNGNLGVAWRRAIVDDANYMRDVWFAVLNPSATVVLSGPTNVTNSGWHDGHLDYDSLHIAVTDDGYFHISWVESQISGSLTLSHISHAIYDQAGQPKALFNVTTADPNGAVYYSDPALAAFDADQMLLFYFISDDRVPGSPVDKIVYVLLANDGDGDNNYVVDPVVETLLFNNERGEGMDAVQLSDGKVALAWANPDTYGVSFAVLPHSLVPPAAPTDLLAPVSRASGRVSVTYDNGGHAVLTWMDADFSHSLYYALVNGSGVVTPAMVFKTFPFDVSRTGLVLETTTAFGNAYHTPVWRLLLPVAIR